MTAYEYVIVDVFTDTALAGNQLAVFLDGDAVPEELKQPFAQEIGFSETVYVGSADRVRIFTPTKELLFAGHPVLGTAHVLAQVRGVDRVELVTGAGPVALRFDGTGRGHMAQPLPTIEPWKGADDALMAALGIDDVLLPIDVYDNGIRQLFVVLSSTEEVTALRPDLGRLGEVVTDAGTNCIAGRGSQWKTRMFGPAIGMAEDPATGSAAGPLAVHVCRYGLVPWGTEITISQGAEIGRPSTLFAVARGNDERLETVEVAGDSVVIGRGVFEI